MPTVMQMNRVRWCWNETPLCAGSLTFYSPFSGPDGESVEYYDPVVALIKDAGFEIDHSERFTDVVPDTKLDKNGEVDWLSYYESALFERFGLTRPMLDRIIEAVDDTVPFKQEDIFDVAMQAILSFHHGETG